MKAAGWLDPDASFFGSPSLLERTAMRFCFFRRNANVNKREAAEEAQRAAAPSRPPTPGGRATELRDPRVRRCLHNPRCTCSRRATLATTAAATYALRICASEPCHHLLSARWRPGRTCRAAQWRQPASPEDPCARRRRGLLQSLSLAPPSGMRIRAAAAVAVAHLSLCRRLLSLGCIRARARSARFAPFRTPVYRATRDADLALSSCLCAHGLPSSGSSLGPTTRWRAR